MSSQVVEDRLRILRDEILSYLDYLVSEIRKAQENIKDLFDHLDKEYIQVEKPEFKQAIEIQEDSTQKTSIEYQDHRGNKPKDLTGYTPRPASQDQIRYLKILYKELGEEPPKDLNKLSKKEASKRIDELKKRLGWI